MNIRIYVGHKICHLSFGQHFTVCYMLHACVFDFICFYILMCWDFDLSKHHNDFELSKRMLIFFIQIQNHLRYREESWWLEIKISVSFLIKLDWSTWLKSTVVMGLCSNFKVGRVFYPVFGSTGQPQASPSHRGRSFLAADESTLECMHPAATYLGREHWRDRATFSLFFLPNTPIR